MLLPSARSLLRNEPVAVERSGVSTIGDPRPTQQALFWGEAEAHTLVKFARHLAQQGEVRVQYRATRNSFIQMLAKRYIVAASCHGVFDYGRFSALSIAPGNRNAPDTWRYAQSRSGSARVEAIDSPGVSDIGTGFARGDRRSAQSRQQGMVQAGSKAVMAALWEVNDKATYLLIVRFAEE